MYATRPHSAVLNAANATLLSPRFTTTEVSCLSFSFMPSVNSNLTLSVFGSESDFDNNDLEHMATIVEFSILWRITSHYRAIGTWQSTEVNVPNGLRRLKFVTSHVEGNVFGLGLDNITLTPSSCGGNHHSTNNIYEYSRLTCNLLFYNYILDINHFYCFE